MIPPQVVTLDFFSQQKYVVAKVLQGGMGSVYQLIPIHAANKTLALKTIKGKSSIRAFDIECEAWFSVAHHPNIARAFAFGTWNSLPSVLVDWYPKSLDGMHPDRLSGEQILDLIRGVIDALEYAYSEMGLIHQDIKPANILIDDLENPRLSDFGLSRCVAQGPKERLELGLGNISKTVTTEISGTPFYMAPELWNSVKPSLKTDIYSLGVTFYHFLTAHHPYIEDKNKPIFGRELRMGPLKKALAGKGEQASRVEEFLAKCVDLNPSFRYQSYREMESQVPRKAPKGSPGGWTLDRSEIIAAASQFYSTKGDAKKGTVSLERHLRARPGDPVLMQGLAQLKHSLGLRDQAEAVLSESYEILRKTSGVYEGRFVTGPVFSLANCLILGERFSEAAALIEEVLAWEEKLKPNADTPKTIIGSGSYSEVGWYLLFRGDFKQATNELEKYAAWRSLDKIQTIWLIEASWLADTLKLNADEIAIRSLPLIPDQLPKKGELEFAWCRFLLREFSNPLLSQRLWESSPSFLFGEANKLEKQFELKGGSLLVPKSLEFQVPIMTVVDQYTTGGKYGGHIRTLSTPRVD